MDMNLINGSQAADVYRSLRQARPRSKRDLRNYVKVFLGIDVPDKVLCDGHCSPMDYLWHVYSVDMAEGESRHQNGDCVVWANRGGGKTELAAIATLLDCMFKPGCEVRILGGSFEQSSRMYEYLAQFINTGFESFLSLPLRKDKCVFANGSNVHVLTQSAKAVRGQHVHKLRCDEVELFDAEVFNAAKFITQSTKGIISGMEVISTMHRPYGLMQKLVADAEKNNVTLFKWCLWEVIEKCVGRSCSVCAIDRYCGGRAKEADGYLKIDDCITHMKRSSSACFESEILCERPSVENVVFAEFESGRHIATIGYDPNLPLYRAIDFGFVNPFVCLWIQVGNDGVVRIIDEYMRSRAAIDSHGEELKKRTPCGEEAVAGTFCDPAGAGRNDVTGTSAVKELGAMGIRTKYRKSGILAGIELIRRSLRAGDGQSRLIIDPKCIRLIEAMRCYHYPDDNSGVIQTELPLKDGVYDHPIDALRYFFVNYNSRGKTVSRRY